MPRLRQVPRAEATSEVVTKTYDLLFGDRDPVAEPGTTTGTPGDWWTVFALVPDVLEHANRGFALYRSPKRKLDPSLRELAQTRVGWAKSSQFVYSQHCKSLRGLKVDEAKIAAIPHWQVADCYDARERAVLAYADCLALQGGRTPDAVFGGAERVPFRRGDPGTDLHRLPLRHACGDEPGPADRMGRPRRSHGRGGGAG